MIREVPLILPVILSLSQTCQSARSLEIEILDLLFGKSGRKIYAIRKLELEIASWSSFSRSTV